ncbi:MAG TPA: hypothetical protein VJ976_01040 [Ornithinimicrobium sp.]|uniref:hypothetical protein n=1 Tax=Ornithinimicrobium sp. TaxID=1977084 RepID=UPI002B47FCD7|nr:hypothetical protein [Ornithinimicrobium sp.]HKJ10952.1 hypothetical protein [Ornithinimicrobium sp.]
MGRDVHAAPDLSFLIPPTSENRWTDLLATFIATDPEPISELVEREVDGVEREVLVRSNVKRRRGVAVRRADRLDLLLRHSGQQVAAVEAKLLAPLGPKQLERYEESFPGVPGFVLHLDRFPMVGAELRDWQSLTWETVLNAYTRSRDEWVALTANVWRERLGQLVPEVNGSTRWNKVPVDVAGFEVALRARLAWLHEQFSRENHGLEHDLVVASNGGSWILRFWLPDRGEGQFITAELSERLPAPAWKLDEGLPFADRVQGPQFLVGLRQEGVKTSASFNWDLLRRLFTDTVFKVNPEASGHRAVDVVDGRCWSRRSAAPRSNVDRDNHVAMQKDGAPPWLGQGYGMAQAKAGGACVFGARFTMSPGVSLDEVHQETNRTVQLLRDMARAAG